MGRWILRVNTGDEHTPSDRRPRRFD